MMEGITGYLILALGSSLVFIGLVVLSARFKKPIRSRETVIKGLVVTGFILFARKLIYYIPFDGVIQTKFSIWWVDANAQTLLVISIAAYFMIGIGIQITIWDIRKVGWKEGCLGPIIGMPILVFLGILTMNVVSDDLGFNISITGRHLISIVLAPLLEFKILCSGKYLGLLTTLILGYFGAAGYKKLTPGISKIQKIKNIAQSMFLIAGLMLLIFVGFSFYKSLGNFRNWEQQLNNKVLSVIGETEMMDLLDAVNSINQEQARYQSLEQIVSQIVKQKEFRWKKEIYQLVIDAILPYDGHWPKSLLKKIALWIAGNGDVPWAVEVAMSIQDKIIKTNVLKEIRQRTVKK